MERKYASSVRVAQVAEGLIRLSGSVRHRGQELRGRVEAEGYRPAKFALSADGGRHRLRLAPAARLTLDVDLPSRVVARSVTVAFVHEGERIFATKVERERKRWSGTWPEAPLGKSRAVVFARNPVYVLEEFELEVEPDGLHQVFDCRSRPWRVVEFEVELPEVEGPAFLYLRPIGVRDPLISLVYFKDMILTDGKTKWLLFGPEVQGIVHRFGSSARERIPLRAPPQVRWLGTPPASWKLQAEAPGFPLDQPLPWVANVEDDRFFVVVSTEWIGDDPRDRLLFPVAYTVEAPGVEVTPLRIPHPAPAEVRLRLR